MAATGMTLLRGKKKKKKKKKKKLLTLVLGAPDLTLVLEAKLANELHLLRVRSGAGGKERAAEDETIAALAGKKKKTRQVAPAHARPTPASFQKGGSRPKASTRQSLIQPKATRRGQDVADGQASTANQHQKNSRPHRIAVRSAPTWSRRSFSKGRRGVWYVLEPKRWTEAGDEALAGPEGDDNHGAQ